MTKTKIKPWEELTITDDYMFKRVMQRKRICKKVLEEILHVKIKKITYLDREKEIQSQYGSKAIRIDVYARDDKNIVYDIEMQVRSMPHGGLELRARFYQSTIDADLLAAGKKYTELNRTIIIFLCPFPLFDGKRHIYTFRNVCLEDKDIVLDDRATRIFLSSKGEMDDVSKELKAFLDYMNGVVTDSELVRDIDATIKDIKAVEREKVAYMTFAMKIEEEREIARAEGRSEGKEEGRIEQAIDMMREDGKDAREIISYLKRKFGLDDAAAQMKLATY